MAIQISGRHLSKVREQMERMQSRVKNISAKAEESMEAVLDAGLTAGAAAGVGLLHGKHGTVEILGVPLELGVAVGGHALAFFGMGGKMKPHFRSLANGALAVYSYNIAKGAGQTWKAKALVSPAVKGAIGEGLPSDRLSHEETTRMQAPVAAQR